MKEKNNNISIEHATYAGTCERCNSSSIGYIRVRNDDDDVRRKRDVKTLLFFYFHSSLAEQHNAGGPISLLISIFIIITHT